MSLKRRSLLQVLAAVQLRCQPGRHELEPEAGEHSIKSKDFERQGRRHHARHQSGPVQAGQLTGGEKTQGTVIFDGGALA